jgi:hypothetical protein
MDKSTGIRRAQAKKALRKELLALRNAPPDRLHRSELLQQVMRVWLLRP